MKYINGLIIRRMSKKVRLSNWITPEAKKHLRRKSKEKVLSESVLLEIQIMKIK